jgi:hypothetical protein
MLVVKMAALTCENGHGNPDDAQFCETCGSSRLQASKNPVPPAATMGYCGHWNRPGARFCETCGTSLVVPALDLKPPDPIMDPRQTTPTRRYRGRPAMWPWLLGALVLVIGAGSGAYFGLVRHQTGSNHHRSVATKPRSSASTTTSLATTTVPTTTLPAGSVPANTTAVSSNPLAPQVALTFETYFGGISNKDFQEAYSAYSPTYQASVSEQQFASSDATSSDSDVAIMSITSNSDGSITVDVDFTSQQSPADGPVPGETCTDWTLAYTLVPATAGGALSYLIETSAFVGSGHVGCAGQP